MPPRRRLQQVDLRRIADLVQRRGGDHYSVVQRFARTKGLNALDRLKLQRIVAQQQAIDSAIRKAVM